MIFIPFGLVKYSLSYGDLKTKLILGILKSYKKIFVEFTFRYFKIKVNFFENLANISIFYFPGLSDTEFQALSDDLYPIWIGEIFVELWRFKD